MADRQRRKRGIAIAVIVAACALFVAGVIWTATQAVIQKDFKRTYAEITEIKTGETKDGMEVILHVFVKFQADGRTYENVDYVGDYSRCRQGISMRVYYNVNDPSAACYQRASDLGFALILMLSSLVWLVVTIVVVIVLRRTGDL